MLKEACCHCPLCSLQNAQEQKQAASCCLSQSPPESRGGGERPARCSAVRGRTLAAATADPSQRSLAAGCGHVRRRARAAHIFNRFQNTVCCAGPGRCGQLLTRFSRQRSNKRADVPNSAVADLVQGGAAGVGAAQADVAGVVSPVEVLLQGGPHLGRRVPEDAKYPASAYERLMAPARCPTICDLQQD